MFSLKTNTDITQEKVKIKVKKMAIKVTIVNILGVEYFVLSKPSSISKSDLFKQKNKSIPIVIKTIKLITQAITEEIWIISILLLTINEYKTKNKMRAKIKTIFEIKKGTNLLCSKKENAFILFSLGFFKFDLIVIFSNLFKFFSDVFKSFFFSNALLLKSIFTS